MKHFNTPVYTPDATYRQDLLPMRLQNAVAFPNDTLRYPANFAIPPQAPKTKQDMVSLTGVFILLGIFTVSYQRCYPGPNCQIVANALNLPALPDATIAQRRQQIIDFLGCGITV